MTTEFPQPLAQINPADADGQQRIEQLFRHAQVGRCVNGVTHDINNYLGAVLAYAEMVQLEREIGPEQQQMLERIIEAVEKSSRLVTALTVIARPETNNVSIADINVLLRDMLLIREYAMRINKIQLNAHYEPSLPSVTVNAPKVQLALLYLLLNSEEALLSETDKVREITVRTIRDGNAVAAIIHNNGAVIPESLRDQMFDVYVTTKEDNAAHIGLGLSLARRIAEQHQGSLAYDPGCGFTLRLPLAQTE